MSRNRTLKVAAGVVASFAGLVAAIVSLLQMRIVTLEIAKLMLVALLGLYVGFGILIAVYRLMRKLD